MEGYLHPTKNLPLGVSAVYLGFWGGSESSVLLHQAWTERAEPRPQPVPVLPELPGRLELGQLPVEELLDLSREDSPASLYRFRLNTPSSRQTADKAFSTLARVLRDPVSYRELLRVRAVLVERYAPATVNKLLAVLRGLAKEAFRLGRLSYEQLGLWLEALDGLSFKPRPAGRRLPAEELQALFRVCAADTGRAGRRDAALVAVLYGCGLRRAEAIALERGDYDGESLRVPGKGRKVREVYCPAGTVHALESWLLPRGDQPGALFCAINKGGRLERERDENGQLRMRGLSGQAVMHRLRKRADEAGIARFSPHDLRRSYLSDLLDAGVDLLTVQQLAGHAQPQTTARYDRRGKSSQKEAVGGLRVPFE